MAYEALEDEFGDVVGKARRGQERSCGEVAAACGLSAPQLEAVEAYELIPEAEAIDALAAALDLSAAKLRRAAAAQYMPADPEPTTGPGPGFGLRMLVLGTDFLMNGYVAVCERTGKAAVVDPGFQPERVLEAARAAGAEIEVVWLTHGHHDHVGGVAEVVSATGAEAWIHEPDLSLAAEAASAIRRRLQPGASVSVGELSFRVVATPGHTPGGVSLVHDGGLAFVGDALFAGSLGGTRRRADYDRQHEAVAEHLLSLPAETVLCPGHGPATTAGEERENNPFYT